jgi:hypothetical protein
VLNDQCLTLLTLLFLKELTGGFVERDNSVEKASWITVARKDTSTGLKKKKVECFFPVITLLLRFQ